MTRRWSVLAGAWSILIACGPSTTLDGGSGSATEGSTDDAEQTASDEGAADETGDVLPPTDECGRPPTVATPSCPDPPVEPTQLHSEDAFNATLAVGDDAVYLVTNGNAVDGTVWRVDKCGRSSQWLAASGSNPARVALSDDHVVWTDYSSDGAVLTVPKGGGERTVLVEHDHPLAVAVVGDEVVYGSPTTVSRVPLAGGTSEEVVSSPASYIVPRGRDLFITADIAIGRVSLDGGGWETIYAAAGLGSLEVHCDVLWWREQYGSMLQGDRFGSTPRAAAPTAYFLARDDDYVYATDPVDDEIWAVPVLGGDAILVAEEVDSAFHIGVDHTHIYWTQTTDGSLWSMANPLR